MAMEGGCACGAVRYRIDVDPIFVNNCHCGLCQRQSGAASAVNAFVEVEHLHLLSGTLSEHEVPTGSGKAQAIVRCAACGTAVWSHYPRLGRLGAAIRVGTLDDRAAIRPDAAIFVADRMGWTGLPDGVPVFETSYKPADILPPDRLGRLMALVARAEQQG
ncbi:GFA family protein [Sphingobium sp. BYY-5]|uniref:GFA family protein n=1 Tax=Sphingobium sp. BYY-5 TaxID=2926400 RepID=UPI001FA6E203|nr:GFA family protein [Sphingobium sp. BYY-5]MCI4589046.1 GFA family protein [Sphingobium sp. BYY-5]